MKMAQFYNPNNSLNQQENKLKLLRLNKRIDQIKTRNNIILTQTTDMKQLTNKTKGFPIKEGNYDQERQKELHDLFLRKIYKKNIKISFENAYLSPILSKNLCIGRKMKQEQINQENTQISMRLNKIRQTSPKHNKVMLPKLNS